MSYKKTYNKILSSSLFRLDGKDINLTKQLTKLGNKVHKAKNPDWHLGEYSECCLSDFIIGAYWSLTEWHGGQNSKTYEAMCSLGQVFNPGHTNGPEPESGESLAYEVINEHYLNLNK
jgi:hypothetical protein